MSHFFFQYTGNKRSEFKNFYSNINLDGITDIYEPFCGTSAISFNLWLNNKDKNYNYYLNDNSEQLINIYKLFINEPLDETLKKVNDIKKELTNKEQWTAFKKNKSNKTVYKYIFFKKFSARGIDGFYNIDLAKTADYKLSKLQLEFIDFIKSPNVFISCSDWFNLFDNNKNNSSCLFIFDPPYIQTCNDFYTNRTLNIYEYFYKNKMKNFRSKIYFILEDIWVIRLLFQNDNIICSYEKNYSISKKKTTHMIIYND